jgi:transcriptional regulator with XRE-family HTH domain
MRKSSISKHPRWGSGSAFAASLGCLIRQRRRSAKLTQAQLGAPLTKGFVSAVEHGRALPSLPALALFADRLGVPLADLVGAVKCSCPDGYTGVHERREAHPDRRR